MFDFITECHLCCGRGKTPEAFWVISINDDDKKETVKCFKCIKSKQSALCLVHFRGSMPLIKKKKQQQQREQREQNLSLILSSFGLNC